MTEGGRVGEERAVSGKGGRDGERRVRRGGRGGKNGRSQGGWA